jgi:hypothetical protein
MRPLSAIAQADRMVGKYRCGETECGTKLKVHRRQFWPPVMFGDAGFGDWLMLSRGKQAEKFCSSGLWNVPGQRPRLAKVFWLLFFKKVTAYISLWRTAARPVAAGCDGGGRGRDGWYYTVMAMPR